jgi:hypothetical protein
MREIFAVTAIALLAFAGQAMASEGVATLAPDLGQIGYADTDSAGGAGGEVFYADIFGALLLVGGLVMVVTSKNHVDSAESA